eukprot:CFRG3350T1
MMRNDNLYPRSGSTGYDSKHSRRVQPQQGSSSSSRSSDRSTHSRPPQSSSDNGPIFTSTLSSVVNARRHFKQAIVKTFRGHKDRIRDVAWSNDHSQLASASADKTIKIWKPLTERSSEICSLTGHGASVEHISWNPKNYNQLFSCSKDDTVRIWDTNSGTCTSKIGTKFENIFSAWSPDGKYIAFVRGDNVVTVLDVRKPDHPIHTKTFSDEANQISWDTTGEFLVIAMGSGLIQPILWPSFELVPPIKAHGGGCVSVAFDPKAKYMAVGSVDTQISLWDLKEMASLRTFNYHPNTVVSLSFSFCGNYLASASDESKMIDIVHMDAGESIHQIEADGMCGRVAWHPSKHFLAYSANRSREERNSSQGDLQVFGYKPVN